MSTLSTLIDSYGDLANLYAAVEDENATLKARVIELEAKNDTIKDDYFKLHDYALELEDRATHLENLLKHARDEVIELEAERDALNEEVERCEATIRFWKKGACDLLQELEER